MNSARTRSHREEQEQKSDVLKICREYFMAIDTNGDGKLNGSEFAKMIEDLGMQLDTGHLKQVYKKADKDGDGCITFKEFLDTYADVNTRDTIRADVNSGVTTDDPLKIIMSEDEIRRGCQYFWSNDKDCDGKLNSVEFSNMLIALGMNLDQRDVSRAFRVADIDGDGYIGFGEFVRAYLNQIQPRSLTNEKIKTIFHSNDAGKKGHLNAKEFRAAMSSLGNDLDNDGGNKLLNVANSKSKNGKIGLNDFCRFLDIESDTLGARMARKALRERKLNLLRESDI